MKKTCVLEDREINSKLQHSGEISLSYMFSLVKDIYLRLSELENKFYNSSIQKNVDSLDNLNTYDIFEKKSVKDKIHFGHLDMSEKNRESLEFLRNMIDEDKNVLFNKSLEAQVMKEMFSPLKSLKVDDNKIMENFESSKRFFKELSSENLLDIFNERNVAKNNRFLDIFLTSLPSVRAMTDYYTLLEEDKISKKIQNELKLETKEFNDLVLKASKIESNQSNKISKTGVSKDLRKDNKSKILTKKVNIEKANEKNKTRKITGKNNLSKTVEKDNSKDILKRIKDKSESINKKEKNISKNKKLRKNNNTKIKRSKVNDSNIKNSFSRQLSRKLVMQHVQSGMEFYFSTGVVVKSIHELYVYLNSSNTQVFYDHVNDYKNDFAQWISTALGYKRFGELVVKIKNREDFLSLLKDVVM